MAPQATESKPMYQKDERALCFHGELLYEAKVLEVRRTDPKDKTSAHEYRVHYKGWKNTWDDWVPQDRLRKLTDENRELAANLKKELAAANAPKVAPKFTGKTRRGQGSEFGSGRGSEERTSSVPAAGGRGSKRARDNDIEKEDSFNARSTIRMPMPDNLKNLLVDDWENVTKSMTLVPLPSKAPANFIFDEYFQQEKVNRIPGSAEYEVLEEFVVGMKQYFEATVGKLLLYRFERPQWQDVRKLWESGKYKEWEGCGPGDCYGAEFVARMLTNMGELTAQTNMDDKQVARLKTEVGKFGVWLSINSKRFFCAKYEKPSAEYLENAR
ncbi:chromatin modification-related protein eaf3 [Exophiala viscosa]|uniref:Chromatin modification-related protein EAF3 n=1 Tax=Exophiala viscosa TaxID=2486360 RepID=A0AAN6DVT4_9EURO|nr:chromatin modification-related protein eaf3 [Exophiala viscosa]